ncbi:MAG: tRNA (adenosine(37)-N6)-dimethylallyltransferase MiaA [Alphaproteobacteria bacterium]|nr:tRNA (adenosine(37)-N6)-dimethylallyltransferase MiaA [Alphaproteobacteria bacterium]
MEEKKRTIWLLGGPTASGKSALALLLAERTGAVIINADSQQVYAPLRILTARPSMEEEARAEHRLYGVLPGLEACSAGKWLELVKREIDAAHARGRPALVVGGTGLYLRVLREGIAPIPDIDPQVRQGISAEYDGQGEAVFRQALKAADPDWEARIKPGDRQRLIRGMEVWRGTGRALSSWQQEVVIPPYPPDTILALQVAVERERLYRNCDARVARMFEAGAVEEVRALSLPPEAAVRKVIGVPQISAMLAGAVTRDEALYDIRLQTRHYAKRQMTWFRNQYRDAATITRIEDAMERLHG